MSLLLSSSPPRQQPLLSVVEPRLSAAAAARHTLRQQQENKKRPFSEKSKLLKTAAAAATKRSSNSQHALPRDRRTVAAATVTAAAAAGRVAAAGGRVAAAGGRLNSVVQLEQVTVERTSQVLYAAAVMQQEMFHKTAVPAVSSSAKTPRNSQRLFSYGVQTPQHKAASTCFLFRRCCGLRQRTTNCCCCCFCSTERVLFVSSTWNIEKGRRRRSTLDSCGEKQTALLALNIEETQRHQ